MNESRALDRSTKRICSINDRNSTTTSSNNNNSNNNNDTNRGPLRNEQEQTTKMVISSFISSVLILALGIWAYMRLESSMNSFAERQLLIEPSKVSFKMWKDMPVSMYQSFTFFNLTNWNQVKSLGQKPRFVEVGPYVYKTVWSKADVGFFDDDKQVSFAEKKQWHFQASLSRGHEDDLIWTINTPLMTALALIQNAPVITRNIVSVILDGLGEGAFIKRPIRSLLFEGYSDLIVSVGPLFDRRFANFNGKFAYLYNKNDTIDGYWSVSTGLDELGKLNKINRFHSSIVNMTGAPGQAPQGLNEVKAECAPAWSLEQSTNGQLFAPFSPDLEQARLQQRLQQIKARALRASAEQHQAQQQAQSPSNARGPSIESTIVQAPKRFFSRISGAASLSAAQGSAQSAAANSATNALSQQLEHYLNQQQQLSVQEKLQHLRDEGKFIFYPDLCRPIHLLPGKQAVTSENGIAASRYFIDPRVFMNSSQAPANKCYEMNPRPALANALAATINSVTGANVVNVPNLVASGSSPFALLIPPALQQYGQNQGLHHSNNNHHPHHHNPLGLFAGASHHEPQHQPGLFERSNLAGPGPGSFLNNALHSLSASANQAADQLAASASNQRETLNSPIGRLGRVRQLFSNIVSQRMSGASPLLPSLSASPVGLFMGGAHGHQPHQHQHQQHFGPPAGPMQARSNEGAAMATQLAQQALLSRQAPPSDKAQQQTGAESLSEPGTELASAAPAKPEGQGPASSESPLVVEPQPGTLAPLSQPAGHLLPSQSASPSDRWVTQFRFKWPRGVFSIGQCQLGAPIYVSLPHFLDADEFYLEQVDGLKPNRSLHEFYMDVESTLHSVPVGAKARLQLNVATPELRFRNIPNAMIPVLWQEVTFKMDKPVATMLYWSFTMSSKIYTGVAVLLIGAGLALLVVSLVSAARRAHRARVSDASGCSSAQERLSCSGGSGSSLSRSNHRRAIEGHTLASKQQHRHQSVEGQRSSWQHVLLDDAHRQARLPACGTLLGASNRAFSCHELANHNDHHHDHENDLETGACDDRRSSHGSTPSSRTSNCAESDRLANQYCRPRAARLSSKQLNDWSRASSHCELVSSYGAPPGATVSRSQGATGAVAAAAASAMNCSTNCLFTCLRHSPPCASGTINATAAAISSAARHQIAHHLRYRHQTMHQQQQQQPLESLATTTSDIDAKTSLSSDGSSNSVGSCSSVVYGTQTSRTFRKGSRASR